MTTNLSNLPSQTMDWNWAQIELCYKELAATHLTPDTVQTWLENWTRLKQLLEEVYWRLYVATTLDTTDQKAEHEYKAFFDNVYPKSLVAEQKLKIKLLKSGLTPSGLEIPLRNMRCEVELYRESNVALISKLYKLAGEYSKITGAQTVNWEGEEVPLAQLQPVYQNTDREKRERAWRLASRRQLADRATIDALWVKYLDVRRRVAINADLPDYRAYRWQRLLRFDYTPEDCYQFHEAVEEVVVPAALRIYERRRDRMGLPSVRPWDLDVDPFGRPPLQPFETLQELESTVATIFHQINPQLGRYFQIMRAENLLNLESRKGKAPGAYCTEFRVNRRPFVFMNASGTKDDVNTLLHETGHAFHVFETSQLPYHLQLQIPLEFMEVASIAMELLAQPYLESDKGGFYSQENATRAAIHQLEQIILFWPYITVVDAFQHWVYENHEEATNPANCDAVWSELWRRYMVGEDWDGLEDEMATIWQNRIHIHQDPFYYVEYGLAQLAAVQIYKNSLQDHDRAIQAYRRALSLGGTVSLPELYATAGAKLAFDAGTIKEAVEFLEQRIEQLEVLDYA